MPAALEPPTSHPNARQAVELWQAFARAMTVTTVQGKTVSWREYLEKHVGPSDERTLVAPVVFPSFANVLLGFTVGTNLSTEKSEKEGRPDFVPADAVTHPFVFEVKGSECGPSIAGPKHHAQVSRYLKVGGARVKWVILTNLVGLKVFGLVGNGDLTEVFAINLRDLATLPLSDAAAHKDANALAQFLWTFRHRTLNRKEKIAKVASAPPWNPGFEVTDTDWIVNRIGSVVSLLSDDVEAQATTALRKSTRADGTLADAVLAELRVLEMRVGAADKDVLDRTLLDYRNGTIKSTQGQAYKQFQRHTAFYVTTRLLLVRAWEDLGLLDPRLYNGGFKKVIAALNKVGAVADVAFKDAGSKYPALFYRRTAYSWYEPSENAYIDAVFELANTYLRHLSDDILGDVYQRQLSLVDRKKLGQYYTPRDIIGLIWDLIDSEAVLDIAEDEDRPLRVLDIATGSGGFLVEIAHRAKTRILTALKDGATIDVQDGVDALADGLIGAEVSQFSAYLTEVNLVLQTSGLIQEAPNLVIPGLRIMCRDTLSLHNPDMLGTALGTISEQRIIDPSATGEWLDVAIGNPPYIGEKSIATTKARLLVDHPYWAQFSASRQDYLYFFLILGVSKLRQGGRFGFITTEYWLNARGAAPLRKYLAKHCEIDHLVLFREMRLFPDAPGQHNLIITGRRLTDPDERAQPLARTTKPKVSVYTSDVRSPVARTRARILADMAQGRSRPAATGVVTRTAPVNPAALGGDSWAEVIMNTEEIKHRRMIQNTPRKAVLAMSEGVICTPQRYKAGNHKKDVTNAVVADIENGGIAGIFELTDREYKTLLADGLTREEKAAIRPTANTADIYPYAVVLPERPDRIIWLPAEHSHIFPSHMPALFSHLSRFKTVLEKTVLGYKATRPWWSAHRPRTNLVDGHKPHGNWSDLAVMNRWGDSKLLTGLLPKDALPLSGLHAVTGDGGDTKAAYLVGLINSTPVIRLATALAPGSVDQDAIEALGLPLLSARDRASIERATVGLADVVRTMVVDHRRMWPLLPEAIRGNINVDPSAFEAWLPDLASGPKVGTIASVTWIRTDIRNPRGKARDSYVVDDLLVQGPLVRVDYDRGHIDLGLTSTNNATVVLDALAHLGSAIVACRYSPGEVDNIRIHTRPEAFTQSLAQDQAALSALVSSYRAGRDSIDVIVGEALSG